MSAFLNKITEVFASKSGNTSKTVVIIKIQHTKWHYIFLACFGLVLALIFVFGGVLIHALGIGG